MQELHFPPGNRLAQLSANRKEQYSIRINDRWRVYFRWSYGQAIGVDTVDYHYHLRLRKCGVPDGQGANGCVE